MKCSFKNVTYGGNTWLVSENIVLTEDCCRDAVGESADCANLLFMQHHLTVKGAPEGSHSDKWLPNSTYGPGEDVIELHAVDGVPTLPHGVQGHRVTSGHVDGICETKPHSIESYMSPSVRVQIKFVIYSTTSNVLAFLISGCLQQHGTKTSSV